MHQHARTLRSVLAAAGLAAAVLSTSTTTAHAMPERLDNSGTVVWCEGDGATLTAENGTLMGVYWSAGMQVGDAYASAFGGEAILDGDSLRGSFPAFDEESGEALGDLTIDGTIARGETEVLSGWDIDPDGIRHQTEGTRTPLSGEVTLGLGEASTTLQCFGWELDTEVLRLVRNAPSDVASGWWSDSYELGEGAGTVGFYGDQQHELGVSLDLSTPTYAFAGERLQIRNGQVDGTLLLRDPETWAVVGMAEVSGTVTETGRERTLEAEGAHREATEIVRYDVALTIVSDRGEWSGTWEAIYQTDRSLHAIPPKNL